MAKKGIRATLGGRQWRVRLSRAMKKHCGWCDHGQRELVISTNQNTEDMIDTVIHEALHAIFPYHQEEAVAAAATEISDLLSALDLT